MSDTPGGASLLHPLAIVSFRHWLRLLRSGGTVDLRHWRQAAGITALSPMLALARLHERLVYGRRLRTTAIDQPPVFIIGHWRTGTTHLHNLMAQDPALAFVSTYQTVAPDSFLTGRRTLRPLMALSMPDRRPMDNMALGADLPQEEEFAICNISPYSMYVGWYFPRLFPELFRKYVLFDGVSEAVRGEWREAYLSVLKKATLSSGGKRLVLKNPANTGRVRLLMELFPGAKFIHIYRDPYVVFHSTQRLHRSVLRWIGLQDIGDDEIEENVLTFFRDMMGRYFDDRAHIPKENLCEVRFEELEARPMEEMARVYAELGLPGWQEARGPVERYIGTQAGYKKSSFTMCPRDVAKVEAYWQFAIDAWGYRRPPFDDAP